MNTSTHELIEQYIERQMPDNDRIVFEQRIAEDADLRATVALYTAYDKALGASALNQFRHTVELALQAARPVGPLTLLHRFWLPTTLLILILSAAGWFLCHKSGTAEQVFARHFKPEFSGVNVRGSEQNADDLHQKALEFYQKGEYSAALETFETLLARDGAQHNSAAYLELAQLYLLNKRPDAARRALEQVSQGRDDEKNWYTALSFVQEHRFDEAAPYLEKLTRNDGPYQKEAAEVLEEIRR